MPELHIKSLTCDKPQDSMSPDEATLENRRVRGLRAALHAQAGDRPPNIRRDFTGSVSVTLYEEDRGSADDNLGVVAVPENLAGQGDQTGRFTTAPNAEYHMVFHVHP